MTRGAQRGNGASGIAGGGDRAERLGSLLGWVEMGLPVIMAGDHERAGRYVARLLFTCARRRWRELKSFGEAALADKDAA